MSLRRAEPADASAIRELSRAAYAKWVPGIGGEPLPMSVDYDQAVGGIAIELAGRFRKGVSTEWGDKAAGVTIDPAIYRLGDRGCDGCCG